MLVVKSSEQELSPIGYSYDDSVGMYYSFDSNVGNSSQISIGDLVVVREDHFVAGWALVEKIEHRPNSQKILFCCPGCNKPNPRFRTTVTPAFKCDECKIEFEESQILQRELLVTEFKAFYANSWQEAVRPLSIRDPLVSSALSSKSTYSSIRPLSIDGAQRIIHQISGRSRQPDFELGDEIVNIAGGHVEVITRRRRGQREFRLHLLERFGEVCAFSGEQPAEVLEAAHVVSFAKTGLHDRNGGLLLRRDFHTLFDRHLMTVNPSTWQIEVAPSLSKFETYRGISGNELLVEARYRPRTEILQAHYVESQSVFEIAG
jgi:HNH endonuclease